MVVRTRSGRPAELISGDLSPFWIWVQLAIVVCVLVSATIAVVKLI
jgi:hypothetical protein